jgi:hypothetical protein
VERDYIPFSPGDLVEILRESIIFRIGDRGWIESVAWARDTHDRSRFICVVQLFNKPETVRILTDDLQKIS